MEEDAANLSGSEADEELFVNEDNGDIADEDDIQEKSADSMPIEENTPIAVEPQEEEPVKFIVVYCQQNWNDVMAAVILRDATNCKIHSFIPDIVPGVADLDPNVNEIIIFGTFWNGRLSVMRRSFPDHILTVIASQPCPEIGGVENLSVVVEENSIAWIKREFNLEIPEYLNGNWSGDLASGINFSDIDITLEEKFRALYSDKKYYEHVSNVGELLRDFRVTVARKRVGDFAGIITATNGNRFAICNATEFVDETHNVLSQKYPETSGTVTFIKNHRRDTVIYEMRSQKINVIDQMSAFSPSGTPSAARIEIFGTHRSPPF